ncbi:MAG: terminase family protein [Oceanobacter sp.]
MDLSDLSRDEKLELYRLLEEKSRRLKFNRINGLFPDEGPLRRAMYPKHVEFFRAGLTKTERLFMAGNRVGKTEAGGVELTYHLTGNYPEWWEGKKIDRAISALAAGDTSATTRDIIQKKLCGGEYGTDKWGTGLIPRHLLGKPTPKSGVPKAYEEILVKHEPTGEWSTLKLRTYEQGRKIFQGTEEDFIWMDEECPYDVYEEALVRLMTTGGIFILTFTPLSGLTELVKSFLSSCKSQDINDDSEPRYKVQAGWNHAPHLTEEQKDKLAKTLKLRPHQLKARKYGTPSLGAGAVYPLDIEEIKVKPFMIPKYWPKAYGLDVGWNRTAGIWGAWDRENDIVYLYSEHYMGQSSATEHSTAIKGRGSWIKGTIDPASRGRSQKDGERLFDDYVDNGLDLVLADNAVEAGIVAVMERLITGRLKIFGTLGNLIDEFGLYRRDEKNGKVVKEDDHLMDAMRYLIMMLMDVMTTKPIPPPSSSNSGPSDWRAM